MTTTFHLRVWTRYNEPIGRVWEVKTDPKLLADEFPCGLGLKVDDPSVLSDTLANGGTCRMDARFGITGIAWPVHITEVEPGKRFRDVSENALFSRYEHDHIFEETPDGARYIDAVTFTPKFPAPKLAAILTKDFFVRRHRAVAKILDADTRTVGTNVLRVLLEELPKDSE
jgi:ligand-binding SRPBCC domain-containing protein